MSCKKIFVSQYLGIIFGTVKGKTKCMISREIFINFFNNYLYNNRVTVIKYKVQIDIECSLFPNQEKKNE